MIPGFGKFSEVVIIFSRYIPIVRIVVGEIPLDPIKSPLNHN